MSAFIQEYYNVPGFSSNTFELGDNVVETGNTTSKISVMAPPGTTIQLKAKEGILKNILIGPSGIYDFDEEEIEIDTIIVPESGDYSDERAKYEQILNQIIAALKDCLPQEGSITTEAYQNFCSSFQSILKNRFTNEDIITTATAATAHYLAIAEDFAEGNKNLSNVVINYITN